ncbi:MAG: hypothetical protein AAGJ46_21460 [Planctomycetota bacterium]
MRSAWLKPITAVVVLVAVGAVLSTSACRPKNNASDAKAKARNRQQALDKSGALIGFVADQYRELPDLVPVVLSPPAVVLDSTSSRDGRDVMAVAEPPQGVAGPMAPLQTIVVPDGNANFRSAGVRGGDTIKCFLLPDSAARNRLMETGEFDFNVLSHEPIEAEVSQVLGPDRLLVSGGLRIPASIARDLASRVDPGVTKMLVESGLPGDYLDQFLRMLDKTDQVDSSGVALPGQLLQLLPGIAWPFRIEVWRTVDDRMIEIRNSLGAYALRGEPPLGWEPTPDAGSLEIVVERLNQWVRSRNSPPDWPTGEWLDTLPASLKQSTTLKPYVEPSSLIEPRFTLQDGRVVQEATWARDAGRWAGGGEYEPLPLARELFDWSVRHVALADDIRLVSNRPWLTMLYGRGDAAQRAWVFALLCRQQELPVVMLQAPVEGEAGGVGRWLWCALVDDGKAYLFDPQLGLPVPGEGGAVATLSEVQNKPELLRELDLDNSPYPVTAEGLKKLAAFVVGDPFSLSWRAGELESKLTGEDALRLRVDPEAVAAEAGRVASLPKLKLWPMPFERLEKRLTLGRRNREAVAVDFRPFAWRPRLWKARALHLRGKLDTEADARRRKDPLFEPINDHRTAGLLYMHRTVRIPDNRLKGIIEDKRVIYRRAKTDATYWLGVLQFDEGKYRSSVEWLQRTAEYDSSRVGVNYNLARALEAEGDTAAAADLLEASESPQRHGDRLRARRLRAAGAATQASATKPGAAR